MSRLEIKKYAEEDHDQSSVVSEEIKYKLEVTAQYAVIIGKLLQKEGDGKGGSYT